jgi:hypothetical protein
MKLKLLIILLFVLITGNNLIAQDVKPEDVVKITTTSKVIHQKEWNEINIHFILDIKKSWHINSNKPEDPSLTATVLKIDKSKEYAVQKISYPPASFVKLQFSESELALYEEQAVIKVVLITGKNFDSKKLLLKGSLQYQPCNDQTCLFPVNKPFIEEIKLK